MRVTLKARPTGTATVRLYRWCLDSTCSSTRHSRCFRRRVAPLSPAHPLYRSRRPSLAARGLHYPRHGGHTGDARRGLRGQAGAGRQGTAGRFRGGPGTNRRVSPCAGAGTVRTAQTSNRPRARSDRRDSRDAAHLVSSRVRPVSRVSFQAGTRER